MLKITSYLVHIALMCILFFFATSEYSQAIPLEQISCQADEVTIFPGFPPEVIENTRVTLTLRADTPVIVNNDRCILTFSTEVATSQGLQLMVLRYELEHIFSGAPDLPARQIVTLPGPELTQISGGVDETHTFKSRLSLLIPEGNATITTHVRP
jgi:hypothetical protein